MRDILDSIMLATTDDESRFRTVIEAAIESQEVPSFPAFRKEAKATAASEKAAAKRKSKMDKVTTSCGPARHDSLCVACLTFFRSHAMPYDR